MLRVLVKFGNPIPTISTAPCPVADRPKVGSGGTSTSNSAPTPPEILHSVSGESSYEHSSSCAFAARPEISTMAPALLGTANVTGLDVAVAPNCQLASAIRNLLVL